MTDWDHGPRPVMLTFQQLGIIQDALTQAAYGTNRQPERAAILDTRETVLIQQRQWFEHPGQEPNR